MSKQQWTTVLLSMMFVIPTLVAWIVLTAAKGQPWAVPVAVGCYVIVAASVALDVAAGVRHRREGGPDRSA